MRSLLILRHAKSSWDDASLSDFERPLNERGLKAAPQMGALLRAKMFAPDLILSSPATRARETARLVKEAANFQSEIQYEPRIYEASVGDLLRIVCEVEKSIETLMLVGHNPGLENLIAALTGENHHFPTAALAEIELQIADWNETRFGSGRLRALTKPKELNGDGLDLFQEEKAAGK